MDMKEYLREKFTKKLLRDLITKLKTTIRFYNEDKEWEKLFNSKGLQMLGFPSWNVETREELLGRAKEIAQLIGANLKIEKNQIKTDLGMELKKKIIMNWPYTIVEELNDWRIKDGN